MPTLFKYDKGVKFLKKPEKLTLIADPTTVKAAENLNLYKQSIDEFEIARLRQDMDDEINCLKKAVKNGLSDILAGKKARAAIKGKSGKTLIAKGKQITSETIEELSLGAVRKIDFSSAAKNC